MHSDALNYFLPFRRLEPNHENQLTRALLVVLRMSPMAHAAWLRLVAPDRHVQQLPVASFHTQIRAIRRAGQDDVERAELVSVFLTPEEPLTGRGVITESDRTQVLDAVIDYGGELVVVVENKVAEGVDRQARELNVTGTAVRIAAGQEVVVVLWRDLLETFIALRERRLISGAEALLVDDFLVYTEDHFPALGPFRTLGLAHGNQFRQGRRLRQLLGEAVGLEAATSDYGPYIDTGAGDTIGASAYLRMTEDQQWVEFVLFPADTLSQARAFYTRPANAAGIVKLRQQPGWYITPNFHFGHMQRGFCWTTTTLDLDAYLALCTREIAATGVVPRSQWEEYWAWLEAGKLASPQDRTEFDRHFTSTQRQSASPRPGLRLARRWPLTQAEELDSRGALHGQVQQALNTARDAFTQPRRIPALAKRARPAPGRQGP